MEVIRIKSIDLDKIYTENWEAVYTIVSGNEAGYFDITTDRKTNEGILMVKKVSCQISVCVMTEYVIIMVCLYSSKHYPE